MNEPVAGRLPCFGLGWFRDGTCSITASLCILSSLESAVGVTLDIIKPHVTRRNDWRLPYFSKCFSISSYNIDPIQQVSQCKSKSRCGRYGSEQTEQISKYISSPVLRKYYRRQEHSLNTHRLSFAFVCRSYRIVNERRWVSENKTNQIFFFITIIIITAAEALYLLEYYLYMMFRIYVLLYLVSSN